MCVSVGIICLFRLWLLFLLLFRFLLLHLFLLFLFIFLFGLTRGVRVDHIIRAALESIAYQGCTNNVIHAYATMAWSITSVASITK